MRITMLRQRCAKSKFRAPFDTLLYNRMPSDIAGLHSYEVAKLTFPAPAE
jgi:hypothetical protein